MNRLRRRVSCQELTELAAGYLDGSLPPAAARAVERHLAGCPDCTAYLEQLRLTAALAGRLRADTDVPARLWDVLEGVRRELDGRRSS